jgi:hypothetical protein
MADWGWDSNWKVEKQIPPLRGPTRQNTARKKIRAASVGMTTQSKEKPKSKPVGNRLTEPENVPQFVVNLLGRLANRALLRVLAH